MKKRSLIIVAVLGASSLGILYVRCPRPQPSHGSDATADVSGADAAPARSTVSVTNASSTSTMVRVAFGSVSIVRSWSFCTPDDSGAAACSFPLASLQTQPLPLAGQYLNATIAFGAPSVGCGSTKAELNINNPQPWYDIADVSLVDGYSNKISVLFTNPGGGEAGVVALGPPNGETGNETVFGLFPIGCDICVQRQNPSCGRTPGNQGCKTGTQYNPIVPCQYQGPLMGGGSAIVVTLNP